MGVGTDDFGGGFGAGGEVGAGAGPQVGFGFAEDIGDGQAGALVWEPSGQPPVDGLDVDAKGPPRNYLIALDVLVLSCNGSGIGPLWIT